MHGYNRENQTICTAYAICTSKSISATKMSFQILYSEIYKFQIKKKLHGEFKCGAPWKDFTCQIRYVKLMRIRSLLKFFRCAAVINFLNSLSN